MNQCKYIKTNGEKCKAIAQNGSEYCYFHNPKITEEEKRQARKRGGESKIIRQEVALEPVKLEKAEDIKNLIAETINEVRAGKMDVKIANCIGFLSNHFLKAVEISDISNRVEIVEKILLERRTKFN